MNTSWTGDELAIGVAGIIAITCVAWLALTTLACLGALACGRRGAAVRIAGFAPPIARRVLQGVVVGTAVLMPAAAYAAPPSEPHVLHVGADGRLTTLPTDEVPVVRAPRTTTTSTSPPTAPAPTWPSTPSTTPRATLPLATTPTRPAPVIRPAPPAPPPDRRYVVRAGDNLWRIARTEVTRVSGTNTADEVIARYWQRVIAANRSTLRSGDPSLIFPGEVIALPLD